MDVDDYEGDVHDVDAEENDFENGAAGQDAPRKRKRYEVSDDEEEDEEDEEEDERAGGGKRKVCNLF